VVLFQDETIIRLFPVLRRAWSMKGQQASVGISGENDRRGLFCALDPKTGRRITLRQHRMSATAFQAFLRVLRACYGCRPIWLLLDGGSLHKAKGSLRVAAELDITLVWLPRQAPELNAVDQLWRSVKADVSANRQYKTIDQHCEAAEQYVLSLTGKQTLTKAGVRSENFWLKGKI
jgi:hypothetical protein